VRAERILALALGLALPAMSADLGTLFHSAEERSRLDALRRGEPATPSTPVAPAPRVHTPEVTGFVKRSDGRNTVWIDGRAIAAPSSARTAPLFDPRVVRDVDQDGPPNIKLTPSKKNSDPQ
jgi:hypothetical protein